LYGGHPSPAILRQCHRRRIPVMLSSDAHEPAHLLRDFARGAAVLAEAGYDQLTRFAARRRHSIPLAQADPGAADERNEASRAG
jgi:histidinol-phosphatase (PHP family)